MTLLRGPGSPTGYPIVTHALVFLNVVGFYWEASFGQNLEHGIIPYVIIPARYANPAIAVPHFGAFTSLLSAFLPFLSWMFVHAGWIHLYGNLYALQIFAAKVEDRLGEGRFLSFYLAGGIASGIVHVIANPNSLLPTLGASGAIAAVMGAYLRLFPTSSIRAPLPPLLFIGPKFDLPAWVYVAWWLLLQLCTGVGSVFENTEAIGGVAWWAHIGGFAFGLFVCPYFAARAVEPARAR
jgi:rhomboid family protein